MTVFDPLHQFKIFTLIQIKVCGVDLSITNSVIFMFITTFATSMLFFLGTLKMRVVPGKIQAIFEFVYSFVSRIVVENVGSDSFKYLPLFLSIFLFVLFSNLIGILPYSFTVMSHISATFPLAFVLFLTMTFSGIFVHKFSFGRLFLPRGVPFFISPLMIPIELVSYSTKPISLAIRLFANMVAGHIIIKIIASASVFCAFSSFWFFTPLPVLINAILICFEIFVAILQSYVFTVLGCIYLGNVLHLH